MLEEKAIETYLESDDTYFGGATFTVHDTLQV